MPSKITIIQGHPDSTRRHLCHALADAYADAAEQAGHSVTRIEVADIEFPMLTISFWCFHCGSAPYPRWPRLFLNR
jgi:hypothetical protein